MAGHSQFKNIMYRKGAQDAKRAKTFAKIAREITVAAKLGGTDATANPRLRAALSLARENNMPKDNVDRAISKAHGNDDSSNFEDVRYEGYGPSGVAIIVEGLTDNRNRTASEIRSIFTKYGGSLGESGSVSFSFERVGHLIYQNISGGFDKAFEFAIDSGADNVDDLGDGIVEVITNVEAFSSVRDDFVKKFGDPIESGLIWIPKNYINCSESAKETLVKLIETLEDNDDVQKVFHNIEE
ncbi:MAG: YebC/PmpR family DNA-binding transcriptional regulator [Holosporales bacterium]|jgi:YebC/PmpR family DNA-binding regulatory protein|nr:YebC/PmpR family DNA-binding transcriptional regulator [Holosporales bacterium]